jgi:hypothetical protein
VCLGWVALGVLLVSCGDDSTGSMQTQCNEIMSAFCGRGFKECMQSSADFDACVSSGTSACCQNRCSSDSATPQSSIDQCTAQMHAIPCSAFMDLSTITSAIPNECKGVVRPASLDAPMPPGWSVESAMSTAMSAALQAK